MADVRESNKARQAFEDYFNLGAGRSIDKLVQKYNEPSTKSPPTKHRATIGKWSSAHNWQQRVAERDAEIAAAVLDAIKAEALNTGYAIREKRVADMNTLGELLFEEIKADEKRWPLDIKQVGSGENARPVKILRFNSPLIARYLEVLDNIAAEKGERKGMPGSGNGSATLSDFSIPAYLIGPAYFNVYRDIREHAHTEYLFHGGRGSLKSTFVSLSTIELLINNPDIHVLAIRQIGNTLRDSVFSQLRWAIMTLGLEDKFKHTFNPLEIEYLPTGQKIYFRGADDPIKIKSIKPTFGYIGILWFEELDQFRGPEPVRNIEQSAIRGGDLAYIFKSFNVPRTANNWANKYLKIPKATQFQHFSNYQDVPADWLGKTFLDEAEHLSKVNPAAYEHEYGGIANGTGGMVFENVLIREITDEEIYGADDGFGGKVGGFDRVLHGLDWGYFPDPLSYGKMHYDAAQATLYIFDEYRSFKESNEDAWKAIKEKVGKDLLIADPHEPKSIADFRSYRANIRGAETPAGSVNYRTKWLQSRLAIIIDPKRAPYHAEEFLNYELEQDKNGDFISAYPDKDNHAIDDTGYATNLIWRVRGQ